MPVQVFAHDESRLGLHTIRRRRITAKGVKPIGTVQHDYDNCWVYGSIAPTSGEHFFLLLPTLSAEAMQLFLDEFAKAHADSFNLLVMDNSGAHTAKRLNVPPNVGLVFQPAANPELECVTLRGFGSFYVREERSSWVFRFNPGQRLRALFGWSSSYTGQR